MINMINTKQRHSKYKREIKKLGKLHPGIDLSGSPRNKNITTE